MRQRSVVLAALAVLIILAASAVTAVIRAGSSGAQTAPAIAPPDWSHGGGLAGSGASAAVSGVAGPTVTVPALQLTGSAVRSAAPAGGAASETSSPPSSTTSATSRSTAPSTRTPDGTAPTTSETPRSKATDHATAKTKGRSKTGANTTTTPTTTTSSSPSTSTHTVSTPTTYPSYHDTITPAPKPSPALIQKVVEKSVKDAATHGITQSVVVLDRRTGRTVVSLNANRPVPAVSIAKLLFAADELRQAGGGANLNPDAASNLFDMLRRSNDDLASDYYGYHGESAIVQRVAQEYHLTGTSPAPNPRYWGGITVTAADIASLLEQMLADPTVGPYVAAPMRASSEIAADGYDQEFGMNAVSGAGSKQGWGCCLGGVVAIHSAGFTANLVVVVLSTAYPDATGINVPEVSAFENDPGFKASVASVTATAMAAVDPSG